MDRHWVALGLLGEDELPVLQDRLRFGREHGLCQLPRLFVLDTEELFTPVAAHHDRCEVVKEVFNSHSEDSIIQVPGMEEARVSPVRPHVLVCIDELLLHFICPEWIHIIALAVPLLGIIPWVLQSDQVDLLRFASLAWVTHHHRSDVEDGVHVVRLQAFRLRPGIHPLLLGRIREEQLIIDLTSDDRMIIAHGLQGIVKCAFVCQSLGAADNTVLDWNTHHVCQSLVC